MNRLFKHLFATGLALALTASLAAAPAVIVNADNAETIDASTLSSMLLGKQKFWSGGSEVVIAVVSGNSDAATALEQYTKMDDSRFKSHWQRLAFSGRGTMPKLFSSTAEVVAFVQSNKGAIGVADTSADLASVKQVN